MQKFRIQKMSAADLVYNRMRELIADGTWKTGQKLPAEKDLADMFGVNRLTVRIGLQRLNALGLCETKVGDGSYVRQFSFAEHIRHLADFYTNPSVLESVREFRCILDSACAQLVCTRATSEGVEKLRECAQAFETEVQRYYSLQTDSEKEASFLKTVQCSVDFMTQFFRMSQNELLLLAFNVAIEPIRRSMIRNASKRISDGGQGVVNRWTREYWEICDAVASRDQDRCRRHLLRLIESSCEGDVSKLSVAS